MESKIYIAKYLPIEGEISELDKAFFKEDTLIYKPHGIPPIIATNLSSNGCKRAKLFLCSKDIANAQKGDQVTDGHRIITISNIKMGGFLSEDRKFIERHPWVYLVIGEISSEATWVIDGMEFDLTDFNPLAAADIEHKRKTLKEIHIKCPTCNHYH